MADISAIKLPSGNTYNIKDTNYYHTTGSWSGLTYTATANGGAGALAFTIPTGTTSTTVASGNHTHLTTLASDNGTSTITLGSNTKYKLTAGGESVIFTMPSIASKVSELSNDSGFLTLSTLPIYDGTVV